MLGQKKYLAFSDRYFQRRLARRLHDSKRNVSLQLIKEFLGGVVVIIAPLIWAADNSDHHFAVFPDLGVAHWRLKLLFIFIDPRLEVESPQILDGRHRASYFTGL